jgi:guanine nucleotide-binding protein subunit alpha
MKPLKRSLEALPSRTIRNFRSEKDLQKKHSRIIDRQLDKDSKRVRREAKILVLGAESRQDVLQMMRMTHLGFSEAEFEACRPVVAGYLVSCAKAWSQAVQTSSALQFGATQKHCEVINSYIAESGPGGQLSPEFTTAITSMLELEPVTAMFESGTVVLPDHSA